MKMMFILGSALHSSDTFIVGEGSLTLKSISETMSGEYTCVAHNSLSTDERTMILKIAGMFIFSFSL